MSAANNSPGSLQDSIAIVTGEVLRGSGGLEGVSAAQPQRAKA